MPANAEAFHALGLNAMRSRLPQQAAEFFSRAIDADPSVARYHCNRGEALRASGDLLAAERDYRRAIALDPDYAIAYYNLGVVLRGQNRVDEAIDAYQHAIRVQPNYLKAHFNLANALRAKLKLDDAENAYRTAVRLDPRFAEAWNNLGELLAERMNIDDALSAFSRAISLKPEHAGAHFNRSFLRLLLGEFEQGWPEHEWRWKIPHPDAVLPTFERPTWNGSNLNGRTILLRCEQGLGDTIQFVRYARQVAACGAQRVIVTCQRSLVSLIATVPGVSEVVASGDPLPPFDEHAALLSLPGIFGTTLKTIPADIPYVFPDEARRSRWRERIAPLRKRVNVGLAWAGNPDQANDRNRSVRLEQLAPSLSGVKDARYFSLQKGAAREEIRAVGHALDIVDLAGDLSEFSETAAAIANLDVVVSVCTSVAHVAGAMGTPTITMLCYNADWRWLLGRQESPWYPTMKLVRQSSAGDWEGVARRVCEMLTELHSE